VHYDTSFHDVTHFRFHHLAGNNGKAGMQNSKGSFHILSNPLLPLVKCFFFLPCGVDMAFTNVATVDICHLQGNVPLCIDEY
jgi:hypothetical protein